MLAQLSPQNQHAALARMTPRQIQQAVDDLDDRTAEALLHDWPLWARAEQLPPAGAWFCWLILAGRGWGKTRCGAEAIRAEVEASRAQRIALIAETAADGRNVIVEGEPAHTVAIDEELGVRVGCHRVFLCTASQTIRRVRAVC